MASQVYNGLILFSASQGFNGLLFVSGFANFKRFACCSWLSHNLSGFLISIGYSHFYKGLLNMVGCSQVSAGLLAFFGFARGQRISFLLLAVRTLNMGCSFLMASHFSYGFLCFLASHLITGFQLSVGCCLDSLVFFVLMAIRKAYNGFLFGCGYSQRTNGFLCPIGLFLFLCNLFSLNNLCLSLDLVCLNNFFPAHKMRMISLAYYVWLCYR